MAKTPQEVRGAVDESLAQRTGRPLAEWVAPVQASGIDPLDRYAVRRWLRSEHGIPQNSQWAIADARGPRGQLGAAERGRVRRQPVHRREGGAAPDLRRARGRRRSFGDDVTIEGRGSYTPSPAAGSSLLPPPRPATGRSGCGSPTRRRMAACSGPAHLGQATHKIALRSGADVDGQVLHLLRLAYEQNP